MHYKNEEENIVKLTIPALPNGSVDDSEVIAVLRRGRTRQSRRVHALTVSADSVRVALGSFRGGFVLERRSLVDII